MGPMQSASATVEDILANARRLRVPYFQRGYAWQLEHASRLLDDLLAHAVGERDPDWYPLGAIIVSGEPDSSVLEVADGHQRLITLTIILAVLRDLEDDEARRRRLARCIIGDDGDLRFQTLKGSRDVLQAAVQEDGATLREAGMPDADLSPSESAILENRDGLRERIAALDSGRRRQLADFALARTMLVVITVGDERAARLLFATMHETGVRPAQTDLFKSQLLGQCAAEVRQAAQDHWEVLEARLGRHRMEDLLIDIATLETRAIVTEPPEAALAQAFGLATPDEASRFVFEHLRPSGERYVDIVGASLAHGRTPGPVFRRLQYLGWIVRHDTWRLPALHWLKQNPYEAPETLEFLRRLEALAWVQMIGSEDSSRRDRRYLAIVEAVDQGRALEPGGPFDIRPAERNEMLAILSGPNIVRRSYRHFLLLRLNAIYEGDVAVSNVPPATIEHVFPQRPGAGSRWREDFPTDGDAGQLRHMLGNLTLLTEAEQNRAGNQDFGIKRPIYADSAFALSRRIAAETGWTPASIRARTQALCRDFIEALGIA